MSVSLPAARGREGASESGRGGLVVLSRGIAIRPGVEELLGRADAPRSAGVKGHIPFSPQAERVYPTWLAPRSPRQSARVLVYTAPHAPFLRPGRVRAPRGLQPCGGAGTTGPPSRRAAPAARGRHGGCCAAGGLSRRGVGALCPSACLLRGAACANGTCPNGTCPPARREAGVCLGRRGGGGWFLHPLAASPASLELRRLSFGQASAITASPRIVSFRSLIPAHQGRKNSNLRPL